jgi:hypothetical protein
LLNGGMTKVGDVADAVGGKNHSPASRAAGHRQGLVASLAGHGICEGLLSLARTPPEATLPTIAKDCPDSVMRASAAWLPDIRTTRPTSGNPETVLPCRCRCRSGAPDAGTRIQRLTGLTGPDIEEVSARSAFAVARDPGHAATVGRRPAGWF